MTVLCHPSECLLDGLPIAVFTLQRLYSPLVRLMPNVRHAFLALGLAAPAQAIGVVASLGFPGPLGRTISVLAYVWMLGFPWWWTRQVEGRSLAIAPPKRAELLVGLVLGGAMFAVIVGAYAWVGQTWLDAAFIRKTAATIQLNSAAKFLAFGLYFTLINSLVEEYFWRWFVDRHCRVLLPKYGATVLSAALFTFHHVLILKFYAPDGRAVVLGSLGVFAAGLIWSMCIRQTKSLWVGYISHLLADAALHLVAARLLGFWS